MTQLHKWRRRAREFRLAQSLEVPLARATPRRRAARLGRHVIVIHKRGLSIVGLRQPLREVPEQVAPRRRVAVQVDCWFNVALHDAAIVRVGYHGQGHDGKGLAPGVAVLDRLVAQREVREQRQPVQKSTSE